jgi:alpha-L-fucosidase 2
MKTSILPVVAACVLCGGVRLPAAEPAPMILWSDKPAAQWHSAHPLGNGRLGAMVHGGVAEECIQLNEDTLWAGGPYDAANPGAREALPEARRLIF